MYPVGMHMGDQRINRVLPHCAILRFPVFNINVVSDYLQGVIFHPNICHAGPDIYLGLFISMFGEPAKEGPTRVRELVRLSTQADLNKDLNFVREKLYSTLDNWSGVYI